MPVPKGQPQPSEGTVRIPPMDRGQLYYDDEIGDAFFNGRVSAR
jgi:hypothetical protein